MFNTKVGTLLLAGNPKIRLHCDLHPRQGTEGCLPQQETVAPQPSLQGPLDAHGHLHPKLGDHWTGYLPPVQGAHWHYWTLAFDGLEQQTFAKVMP